MQHGQVFPKRSGGGEAQNWAYRYRIGGRDSKRVQRSGFPTETAAARALERALERARQEQGLIETPTLNELVAIYLAQHDTEPETIEKLRWLLSKATAAFGNLPITELAPAEIAAWRMTIPYGHRFEATQALRQTLARAVTWGMLTTNPPSNASPTGNVPAPSGTRSNHGTNSRLSPTGSDRSSGRSSCSPPRPG